MIRLEVPKIGDALGVVLPQEAIHALDAVEGATFELTSESGGGYLLSWFNADVDAHDVEQ